jgi:hypothetical protein
VSEEQIAALVVRLTGDGSSLQRMLAQAQAAAASTAAAVAAQAKRIEGFTSSITGFARGALGVLGSFGAATSLTSAFQAFSTWESNAARINAVIKASGRDAAGVTADYEKWAASIAKVTSASKGEVMQMLTRAEVMGLQGDQAQQAVQTSIALAGALGGEASEHIGVATAIAQGNLHYAQRVFHLHHIHDQSQLVAAIQQRLQAGWAAESVKAETAAGAIAKLKGSLGGFAVEVGKVVAETIKPFVTFLTQLAEGFKALDPAAKKVVVTVLAIAAALPAIGPALTILKTTLGTVWGPVSSALGVIAGLLPLLLTPMGLLVAAATAAGAAWLYFSGAGAKAVGWLGEQFGKLVDHVRPAIKGVQDALAAGDLGLAFRIVWAQIKLSFATATQGLRETWYEFTGWFAKVWAEASAAVQRVWATAVAGISGLLVENLNNWRPLLNVLAMINPELRKALDAFDKLDARQQARVQQAALGLIGQDFQRQLDDIEKRRVAAFEAADKATADSIQRIRDELKQLEAERNKVVEQAAKAAANVKPALPPNFQPPKIPPQPLHLIPKFDAAALQSAEAVSRIQQFRDMLVLGGKSPSPASAVGTGTAEAAGKQAEGVALLKDIREHLAAIRGKPTLDINPANLG